MICFDDAKDFALLTLFPNHFSSNSSLTKQNKMCQSNKTPNSKHKSRKSSARKISSAAVARKSRTKTRKPKYLSLKLQLSTKTQKPITQKQQQQLNLFPLHPEKDHHHMQEHDQANDDVAFLLETDNNSTTTLHDLLDKATEEEEEEEDEKTVVETKAVSYYGGGLLEKAAMRSKERDASEERWVSYYDVVEEVSSCSGGTVVVEEREKKLVGLKLDYEEIMNAWCDKGPLYVEGESPQIVPDFHASSNLQALGEELGSVGNLWQVPEVGSVTSMDKLVAKEGWKLGQREASVLRYKEKRQNRLFAKRIRYEVRKLNAEKRPRLKGRFVKRDTDE